MGKVMEWDLRGEDFMDRFIRADDTASHVAAADTFPAHKVLLISSMNALTRADTMPQVAAAVQHRRDAMHARNTETPNFALKHFLQDFHRMECNLR